MEEGEKKHCLNCDAQVSGEYCVHCGQKTSIKKITFKDISADFFGSVFNLDTPFPKTLIGLITNPGRLIRAYLAGKRKSFSPPVRFLILGLAINLIISVLIDFNPVLNEMKIEQTKQEQMNDIMYESGQFLHRNINFFIFLLPISMALISKLFFWRFKYNLAERAVFGFYIAAEYLFFLTLLILSTTYNPALYRASYFVAIIYFMIGFYSFHSYGNVIWRFIKSLFGAIIAYILYIFISFTISLLIVKNLLY